MPQFLRAVLSERNFDLSTGQGEKASAERPFVARRLQDTIGIDDAKWGKRQQRTFHLAHPV